MAWRTRSDVGLVSVPGGACSFRPRHAPAMMRMAQSYIKPGWRMTIGKEGRKYFFFEKKKQKTFTLLDFA
jgi:hypothetical protein